MTARWQTPPQPYCAQLGADLYRVLSKLCGRRRKLVYSGWLAS